MSGHHPGAALICFFQQNLLRTSFISSFTQNGFHFTGGYTTLAFVVVSSYFP
jgi:hypothetical protein